MSTPTPPPGSDRTAVPNQTPLADSAGPGVAPVAPATPAPAPAAPVPPPVPVSSASGEGAPAAAPLPPVPAIGPDAVESEPDPEPVPTPAPPVVVDGPGPAPVPGPSSPPAPSREEAAQRSGVLLAGLLFTVVFYVVPMGAIWKANWSMFPFLPEAPAFVLGMLLAFLALWGAVWMVKRNEGAIPGLEGGRVSHFLERLNRSTGQSGRDILLFIVTGISAIVVAIRGQWLWFPLCAVTAFVFLVLALRVKPKPWKMKPFGKNLPTRLPAVPATGPVEEGDVAVDLHWTFPRASLTDPAASIGEGRLRLVVKRDDLTRARETNPTRDSTATLTGDESTRHEVIRGLVCNEESREIERLGVHLLGMTLSLRLSQSEELCNALAAVQSIPTRSDEDSIARTEYWRFPVETLTDRVGDSIDKAVLLAALLRWIFGDRAEPTRRLKVVLMIDWANRRGAVAVGGTDLALPGTYFTMPGGGRYYFCDPIEGGTVGSIPDGVDVAMFEPIPLFGTF